MAWLVPPHEADMPALEARWGARARISTVNAFDDGEVITLAWSPCGEWLAVSHSADTEGTTLSVYDAVHLNKRLAFALPDAGALVHAREAVFVATFEALYRVDCTTLAIDRVLEVDRTMAMAIDEGGTTLALASKWGELCLVDVASGATRALPSDPLERTFHSVCFAGATVFAGTGDGPILRWSRETGAALDPWLGHESAVMSLDVSPDGVLLASGAFDAKIRLWEVSSGFVAGAFDAGQVVVVGVAFSPDQRRLIASYAYGGAVWDLQLRARLLDLPNIRVGSIANTGRSAVHPSGKRLAARVLPAGFNVLDLDTGDERRVEGHTDTFMALGHAGAGLVLARPDGSFAGLGLDPLEARDIALDPISALAAFGEVDGFLMRPLHRALVTALQGRGLDLDPDPDHDETLRYLLLSPDRQLLVITRDKGGLDLVELTSGARRRVFAPHENEGSSAGIDAVAFGDGGHTLWSFSFELGLVATSLRETASRTYFRDDTGVNHLTPSPNGREVLFTRGDEVRMLTIDTGEVRAVLRCPEYGLTALALNRDGSRLAIASVAGRLRLVDMKGVEPAAITRRFAEGCVGISWSPDGRELVSLSRDGTIDRWDAIDLAHLRSIRLRGRGGYAFSRGEDPEVEMFGDDEPVPLPYRIGPVRVGR